MNISISTALAQGEDSLAHSPEKLLGLLLSKASTSVWGPPRHTLSGWSLQLKIKKKKERERTITVEEDMTCSVPQSHNYTRGKVDVGRKLDLRVRVVNTILGQRVGCARKGRQ